VSSDDQNNRWRKAPRSTTVVFLLGVFFIFASFGFVSDLTDMGSERPLRFAIYVILSGLFPVVYAYAGVTLRGKFWKALIPVFVLHFASFGLLGRYLPENPRPKALNAAATIDLQNRLVFDGISIIIAVCLGYTGLIFVSIREGRRYGKTEMEKAVLEGEMTAAREVQRVMVPEDLPQIAGYSIESVYRPAAEVGGDFFQVVPLKSGRALVVIGDVSGKGLRAAMIVSMIVGILSTVSGYTEEPAEILDELNRRLCGRVYEGFVTCLVLRLGDEGRIAIANAGHLPPFVHGAELRVQESLPLGLSLNQAYEETAVQLNRGDALVLLTDGVVEARNPQGELLGFGEVETMLRAGATAREVAEVAERQGQNDDITVLQVARKV
jgi:hypothetical protein